MGQCGGEACAHLQVDLVGVQHLVRHAQVRHAERAAVLFHHLGHARRRCPTVRPRSGEGREGARRGEGGAPLARGPLRVGLCSTGADRLRDRRRVGGGRLAALALRQRGRNLDHGMRPGLALGLCPQCIGVGSNPCAVAWFLGREIVAASRSNGCSVPPAPSDRVGRSSGRTSPRWECRIRCFVSTGPAAPVPACPGAWRASRVLPEVGALGRHRGPTIAPPVPTDGRELHLAAAGPHEASGSGAGSRRARKWRTRLLSDGMCVDPRPRRPVVTLLVARVHVLRAVEASWEILPTSRSWPCCRRAGGCGSWHRTSAPSCTHRPSRVARGPGA